ncbi:MAG: hypothetical protein WD075_06825 [Rhodospirillales bacterium]
MAGAVLLVSTAAQAVDVRNEDEKPQEILLSVWKDASGTETNDTLIKLEPGEVRTGVCEACIISLGKSDEADSVSVEQRDVVTIEKPGRLRIN